MSGTDKLISAPTFKCLNPVDKMLLLVNQNIPKLAVFDCVIFDLMHMSSDQRDELSNIITDNGYVFRNLDELFKSVLENDALYYGLCLDEKNFPNSNNSRGLKSRKI